MNRSNSTSYKTLPLAALIAILVAGCSGQDITESLGSDSQSWSSKSSTIADRAKHVLTSEDFSKSGYSTSERQDFEKQYGSYFGTFEGIAVFGFETRKSDNGTKLSGTALSKQPLKKLTICGELEVDDLSEFKIEQENKTHPFKEMKIDVDYGSSNKQPSVRITSVEKKE
ncbi:MAG: hypothetical protein K2X93_01850 [Candidatus Obscuribacterales bacterium]|nr:hypothetical protein [Candidatus Obscuribacterales bacterium]